MKKNILLVYPPMDEDYYTVGVNDSPPLGLVAIQNYIIRKLKLDVNIEIIDGEYNSLDEILSLIKTGKYDMIGLQPMMASYKKTFRIIEEAKRQGMMTVLGGHHSTHLADRIIKNKGSLVDFVIAGDGEEAFSCLVRELPLKSIPNLVYFDPTAGNIVHTPTRNVPLEDGKIDYFDERMLEQYRRKTPQSLERGERLVSFRTYSHKGCSNRSNSQYCYFCGRADRGVRFKSPEDYVDELRYLSSMPNVKYVFEIGDDFLQDKEWLYRVCELKEKTLPQSGIHLKIFARANRITPEVMEILKRLEVDEVAIGFESGSEKILRAINKNAAPEDNIRAAELLFSNGIDTIASFVLGLPGEDDESLRATYGQAQYVRNLAFKHLNRAPQEIIANLIEVNPGSLAFKKLEKFYGGRYIDSDEFGVGETQNDYFKMEFGLKTDQELEEFRRRLAHWGRLINNLGQYTYPAGWKKGDM